MNSYLYISLYIGIGLAVYRYGADACGNSVNISPLVHLGNGVVGAYPQLGLINGCLREHSYIGYIKRTYKNIHFVLAQLYLRYLIRIGNRYLYGSMNVGI